ncbi:MAG: molybdopterin-dependent oxidoreductase [Nitrososphaerales archaeon]
MKSRRNLIKGLLALATFAFFTNFKKFEKWQFTFEPKYSIYQSPIINEKWVATTCLQCPAVCQLIVRVIDNKAVKIEGNPLSPNNRGGVCPKGQAGLQVLYDPDRIKGPMKRIGERGSGKFERIDWGDAIKELTKRLKDLRVNEPHKFVLLSGRLEPNTFMKDLINQFTQAYGSPNHINHLTYGSIEAAHEMTVGYHNLMAYDFERVNYLLIFGGSLLEAWIPTVRLLRIWGRIRAERSIKAKVVIVDPRLSVSAYKADEWLPIKPGTDGALALGLAHVIIKEGLYDIDYVNKHTYGFDKFKELVIKNYTPEWASSITGIPVDTIKRIAKEFATTKPAIAAGHRGVASWNNGLFNYMAIHALNALVGSIGIPGGVIAMERAPLTPLGPLLILDDKAKQGLNMPRIDMIGTEEAPLANNFYQRVANTALTGKPYEIKLLMIYYTNPIFFTPNLEEFEKAMQKIDYIVSTSPFLGDTELYCDLILPDHTYLERLDLTEHYPSFGFPQISVRQPVIQPLYNTMNFGDLLITLAHEIGGNVEKSIPWRSYEEYLKFRLQNIWEYKIGRVAMKPLINFKSFDEFWSALFKYGFWYNPPYKHFYDWGYQFKTPTSKFEFYSNTLKERLMKVVSEVAKRENLSEEKAFLILKEKWGLNSIGDDLFLIHYEPPQYAPSSFSTIKDDYPFILISFKTMLHAEGRGGNVPYLQELHGWVYNKTAWKTWVQINSKDAAKYGIRDGDIIWVESIKGKVKAIAKVCEEIMPGVIAMPFEQGHISYGRWASGRGANPNRVILNVRDSLVASPGYFGTRVKVYKSR